MGGEKRVFRMAALIAGATIALSGAVALEAMWRDKEAAMSVSSPLAKAQRAEDGFPVVDWALLAAGQRRRHRTNNHPWHGRGSADRLGSEGRSRFLAKP